MQDISKYATLVGDDLAGEDAELRQEIRACFGHLEWFSLEEAKIFVQQENMVKQSEWECPKCTSSTGKDTC